MEKWKGMSQEDTVVVLKENAPLEMDSVAVYAALCRKGQRQNIRSVQSTLRRLRSFPELVRWRYDAKVRRYYYRYAEGNL